MTTATARRNPTLSRLRRRRRARSAPLRTRRHAERHGVPARARTGLIPSNGFVAFVSFAFVADQRACRARYFSGGKRDDGPDVSRRVRGGGHLESSRSGATHARDRPGVHTRTDDEGIESARGDSAVASASRRRDDRGVANSRDDVSSPSFFFFLSGIRASTKAASTAPRRRLEANRSSSVRLGSGTGDRRHAVGCCRGRTTRWRTPTRAGIATGWSAFSRFFVRSPFAVSAACSSPPAVSSHRHRDPRLVRLGRRARRRRSRDRDTTRRVIDGAPPATQPSSAALGFETETSSDEPATARPGAWTPEATTPGRRRRPSRSSSISSSANASRLRSRSRLRLVVAS